ncbi:MAG: chromosomal replication initiator protein DnaA [Chloroflexota bacterium]|nr:chromosomal replication initiator protein DnaA [Chloroflexota bacterium]
MKATQAWQAAIGQLQLEMPKAAFDTWVRDAELITYEDGAFSIGVKNAYARDWLDDRLSGDVVKILSDVMKRSVTVRFIVWQNTKPATQQTTTQKTVTQSTTSTQQSSARPLNGRYSFDSFVVGSSNRLAHAASMAVSEKPAQAYNPLFIYGGVGLGKTHLLHAIGNHCIQTNQHVLYVSSEEFTNDLISAIRSRTTQAFREKYRQTDILLVDDIQFIAGKESTQEEFFHTFNTLHGQNKQIVMTSDRPPKAMVTLEERLRSRFEWGLAADIQPPDFETRMAILHSKAERAGYKIPDEIISIIARKFQSNIRELEGALTRVKAYSDLRGVDIDADLIDSALADLLPNRRELQPDHIVNSVAETCNVDVDRMLGRERTHEISHPRQIAMYLIREETDSSLPQIGKVFGRDHTTVMYGHEKIADLLERDGKVRRQVMAIKEKLYS